MPDHDEHPAAVPPSGTVHWLGAGLSTGSGLAAIAERAERTVLWARNSAKARACLARLGLTDAVQSRLLVPGELESALGAGDVLVSMLPAGAHPRLLRTCVDRRAHFACTSYVSPELLAQVPAAERAGLAVLAEAGLDPGIDHLFAHLLLDQAMAQLGDQPATAAFTSYCGGVPAEPNEFRYRFSWAPLGVLNALREPARYLDGGAERVATEPWEHTREYVLGDETFEAYPNRDSVPFVEQYRIPPSWRLDRFVRGTLRLHGWRQAWQPVFQQLRDGDQAGIGRLAEKLSAEYPMAEGQHDRVVLAVALDVRTDTGRHWSGAFQLDLTGDDRETAMARCVSLPLAAGVHDILAGAQPPGLRRAAETVQDADRWLTYLRANGIDCRSTVTAAG